VESGKIHWSLTGKRGGETRPPVTLYNTHTCRRILILSSSDPCNVLLPQAYPMDHFRSEPRTKRPMPRTKHASDQNGPMPRTKSPCLGPMLHASEQWPEIPAVRFGPKGTSLSHCASAHYSLLSLSLLSYPCPL